MDAGELARSSEDVEVATARVENARAKERRAQQLLSDSVGTAAELEDARAELATAEALLRAAQARRGQLGTGVTPENAAGLSAVTLTAPESGIVTGVHFAVGQTVSDGAMLLEIVRPDPLWVRVPVYVGDLMGISRQAPAKVIAPGEPPESAGRIATPIQGPPTANASAASADLFYRLPNPDGRFRPGERMGVVLEFSTAAGDAPAVPFSAVLYDIYGGTWVYESLGNHAYARRRVEVREVSGGMATLRRGISVGTSVVVVGAAELYSSEFGTTH
jgi:RND family efflux transporter MFP subunit